MLLLKKLWNTVNVDLPLLRAQTYLWNKVTGEHPQGLAVDAHAGADDNSLNDTASFVRDFINPLQLDNVNSNQITDNLANYFDNLEINANTNATMGFVTDNANRQIDNLYIAQELELMNYDDFENDNFSTNRIFNNTMSPTNPTDLFNDMPGLLSQPGILLPILAITTSFLFSVSCYVRRRKPTENQDVKPPVIDQIKDKAPVIEKSAVLPQIELLADLKSKVLTQPDLLEKLYTLNATMSAELNITQTQDTALLPKTTICNAYEAQTTQINEINKTLMSYEKIQPSIDNLPALAAIYPAAIKSGNTLLKKISELAIATESGIKVDKKGNFLRDLSPDAIQPKIINRLYPK